MGISIARMCTFNAYDHLHLLVVDTYKAKRVVTCFLFHFVQHQNEFSNKIGPLDNLITSTCLASRSLC